MMSTQNLFSPADGRPIVAPIQDIVLGLYYLTQEEPGAKGEGQRFSTVEDATVAHALGEVALHAKISVHNLPWVKKTADNPTQGVEAPFGRFILVDCLPDEMRPAYIKKELNKKSISEMVSECFKIKGNERTVKLLDDVKTIGFFYATQSGVTIAMHDLVIRRNATGFSTRQINRSTRSTSSLSKDFWLPATAAARSYNSGLKHMTRLAKPSWTTWNAGIDSIRCSWS